MTLAQARPTRRFALIVTLAFAATSVGILAAPRPAAAWSAGSFSSSSERLLVSLTNKSRASAGLKALKVDSTLTSIARWRSKDMITRGYFSHNIPPSGYNVFRVLDKKHYCYVVAGENIGWNNYPDDIATGVVHQSFMKSPGHRSNILGKRWDVIGIGAYKGPTGKKMWTVIFADKCGSKSSGSGTSGGTKSSGGGTKAVTKPKPKATPRPTPKPTPKPTPVRTMPPIPTDPPNLGPGGPHEFAADATPAGPPTFPPGEPATTADRLRVVDPAPAGLVETIVGGVTGFYLGG
ncbi:MAG: CAP domain-containing protein [Chloroflexota bacterium]